MHILHITDSYDYTGGIRSYIEHLVDSLSGKGHEARIYSPKEKEPIWKSHFSRWISRKYYFEVARAIDQFKPDIVHAHSVSMRLSPLPLLAARRRSIPVVMTVHDFNFVCHRKWMIDRNGNPCSTGFGLRCLVSNCLNGKNGWVNLPYHNLRWLKIALHRHLLKKYVNVFICPSKALSQWMEKSLDIRNVVHTPNFLQDIFTSDETVVDTNRLLFVGRLSKEKGVESLLRAMPFVMKSYPDATLTIVGDGPERIPLEHLSSELRIGHGVHFAGMVRRDELSTYYADASIVILPSLWMENCPVSGIEAMAAGKPVIGSYVGGIPEIVREGLSGFTFRRNDHHELAEKIKLLLGNKDLLRECTKNSRHFFEENFTEEKHCNSILSIYEGVLRN